MKLHLMLIAIISIGLYGSSYGAYNAYNSGGNQSNQKNPFTIPTINFFGDSTDGASSWNVVDTTNSTSANVTLQPSADAFGFADEDIGEQSEDY